MHMFSLRIASRYMFVFASGPGGAYDIPKLQKFSRQFKDTIAYPMLHNTLSGTITFYLFFLPIHITEYRHFEKV